MLEVFTEPSFVSELLKPALSDHKVRGLAALATFKTWRGFGRLAEAFGFTLEGSSTFPEGFALAFALGPVLFDPMINRDGFGRIPINAALVKALGYDTANGLISIL